MHSQIGRSRGSSLLERLGFYFGLNTGDLWFIFGRAHKIGVVIASSINIRRLCSIKSSSNRQIRLKNTKMFGIERSNVKIAQVNGISM